MSVYDTLIRVPLILRLPGAVPQGVRIRGQVQTNDLFGGVLALAGVKHTLPKGARPLPLRAEDATREFTFAEFGLPTQFLRIAAKQFPGADLRPFNRSLLAIRGERFKYIRGSDGTTQLFDLEADSGEPNDLSDAQPNLCHQLDERLTAFEQGRLPTPPPASSR
jgi:arylsulfatase A-like enzyme